MDKHKVGREFITDRWARRLYTNERELKHADKDAQAGEGDTGCERATLPVSPPCMSDVDGGGCGDRESSGARRAEPNDSVDRGVVDRRHRNRISLTSCW